MLKVGAAGVAGVDGGVDLQKIVERPGADIAAPRGDDAGGHGGADAERVADGQDPVADLDLPAITPVHVGELLVGGDADDGDVGDRVDAHDPAGQIFAVLQGNRDARGPADDVAVGHDDAGGVDDEAGAGAADGLAAEAVAEDALGRGPAQLRGDVGGVRTAVLDDGDVDHGGGRRA